MAERPEELTIIGGGPVGLYAAFYAGLRAMRVRLVESLSQLGGQLTALYPEKYILDVPGFPRVTARELAQRLIEQALAYHPRIDLGQSIEGLSPLADGGFELRTDRESWTSQSVLICAGGGALSPKKLSLPGASQLEGRGVYYHLEHPGQLSDQRVLVIGGGDSALDWAAQIHHQARELLLIHRRNEFRAHESSLRHLQDLGIPIWCFWELSALEIHQDRLVGAVLKQNQTGQLHHLTCDAVFVAVGALSSLGRLRHWPVTLQQGSIGVNPQMETPLPGLYAAGDIAGYPGKLKLLAVGFGEAAIAVNNAKQRVDPLARVYPGHSSEKIAQTLVRLP